MRNQLLISALLLFGCNAQSAPLNISTFAGTGSAGFSGDGAAAKSAALNTPVFVASDAAGNVYIADQNNNRIRKVNLQGVITTFAGNGAAGFSGDGGPATGASLRNPTGVFADGLGNVFIADVGNQRIRKVDTAGNIATVAGNGTSGFSGDGGPATSASFFNPVRVIADAAGNLYIADQSNHRVRKVDSSGIVSTFAGSGSAGFSGDGSAATSAALNNPTALALNASGNLYISDQFNHRIRRVGTSGNIVTVAGNGAAGFAGDGSAASSASLNFPGGLVVDTAGTIFFADDLNFRVRQISPGGTISTVAGNGSQSFSGDGGLATAASLNGQFGIALDPSGNLLIADSANQRIRLVESVSPVVPVFSSAAVTNAASFLSGGSAGALATLFGTHLSVNLQGVSTASALPLPTSLGGAVVTVNGIRAPLVAVVNVNGQEQINFQIPWELAGQQSVSVVVANGLSSSAAVNVPLTTAQPGVFVIDDANGGAIEHADGSVVTPASAAARGETVLVFATGLGHTSPTIVSGQAAPGSPLSLTTSMPTVTIAGMPTIISFSGQAPGFVGLNQINLQVPANAPVGSQDLILTINGVASKAVKIALK